MPCLIQFVYSKQREFFSLGIKTKEKEGKEIPPKTSIIRRLTGGMEKIGEKARKLMVNAKMHREPRELKLGKRNWVRLYFLNTVLCKQMMHKMYCFPGRNPRNN